MGSFGAVLDATAAVACATDEPGADKVDPLLRTSVISAVNLAETLTRLHDLLPDVPPSAWLEAFRGAGLTVAPFIEADALECARLRAPTRRAGLSLGDRACLALGKRLGVRVVTAEHRWPEVAVGVTVDLFREPVPPGPSRRKRRRGGKRP